MPQEAGQYGKGCGEEEDNLCNVGGEGVEESVTACVAGGGIILVYLNLAADKRNRSRILAQSSGVGWSGEERSV